MSEKADGRVHYTWLIIAVLGTALFVVLGTVAYYWSRGPGKAAMTAEEERNFIISHITAASIKTDPFVGPPPYGAEILKLKRRLIEFDAVKLSLPQLRDLAISRYEYRQPPLSSAADTKASTITPEEERQHIIDYVTLRQFKSHLEDARVIPVDDTTCVATRRYVEKDISAATLDQARDYAVKQHHYPGPGLFR